ncbi:MAG: hypothetical protein JXP73_19585 [Deltaproteobacteria bacterium]|nr:hypothetical protein [Deltaproteobacteria bacterium]
MSPRLQRLRAEIASDLGTFASRIDDLAKLPPLAQADRASLAEAAVALHHAYGAIESALARIARAVDDGLPEGPEWHQALVQVMALAIDSVRPAVVCDKTRELLQRLLGFRHFFRHAYAVELDGVRLEELRRHATSLLPLLRDDLGRFDRFLADAGAAQP